MHSYILHDLLQAKEKEWETDTDDDDGDDDTLFLKDKDLSTERLVYKSVPNDIHICITYTQ